MQVALIKTTFLTKHNVIINTVNIIINFSALYNKRIQHHICGLL